MFYKKFGFWFFVGYLLCVAHFIEDFGVGLFAFLFLGIGLVLSTACILGFRHFLHKRPLVPVGNWSHVSALVLTPLLPVGFAVFSAIACFSSEKFVKGNNFLSGLLRIVLIPFSIFINTFWLFDEILDPFWPYKRDGIARGGGPRASYPMQLIFLWLAAFLISFYVAHKKRFYWSAIWLCMLWPLIAMGIEAYMESHGWLYNIADAMP